MAGTLVAVFLDRDSAQNASRALVDAGVPLNDISIIVKQSGKPDDITPGDPDAEGSVLTSSVREVDHHDVEQSSSPESGAGGRAAAGLAIGIPFGLFLASAAILIPGIGPVIAAGPLLAMLSGGAIGGVVGGLVGVMATAGIPEEAARNYHDHVEAGNALVAVIISADHAKVEKLLVDKGGREVGYYERIIDSVQSIES